MLCFAILEDLQVLDVRFHCLLIQSSITESLSELGGKESKGERVGKVGIREFEPVVDRHVGNADGERGERREGQGRERGEKGDRRGGEGREGERGEGEKGEEEGRREREQRGKR